MKVLQEFVRYCLNGREYEVGADYLVVFRFEAPGLKGYRPVGPATDL